MQSMKLFNRIVCPSKTILPRLPIKNLARQRYPWIAYSPQYSTDRTHPPNMSTHTLDKTIFNQTLYKNIQAAFFEGVELGTKNLDSAVLKRWFPQTPDEKVAFDTVCRELFGPALEAIGPEQFPQPSAEPFVQELREMAAQRAGGDGSEVAWTAVSMSLLLDQATRNIFRTNEGLAKVYNHYDIIAHSLAMTLLSPQSPIGRPDLHPQWRLSLLHRMWFYLPLVHSEDIASHALHDQILSEFREELKQNGDNEAMLGILQRMLDSEKEHRDILDRFGRYPHRNHALGRTSTPEETKFIAEGGATFGVAQNKTEA